MSFRARLASSLTKQNILFLILISILSALAFGKAINLNYWRDDWGVFWMLLYDPGRYFHWIFTGRHPGEFLYNTPWVYIFGTHHLPWAIMGIGLKMLSSLTVGLVIYGITHSKKLFFVASILFASYFGGLEAFTWISARLSIFFLMFLNILFFIYLHAYNTKQKWLYAFCALYIFMLLIEPGKSIFIPFVLLVWETAQRFISKTLRDRRYLLNIALIFFIPFLVVATMSLLNPWAGGRDTNSYLTYFLKEPQRKFYFFSSLTNLIAPYIYKPLHEQGGLSEFRMYYAYTGIAMLIGLALLGFYSTFKRHRYGPFILTAAIWIPIFFFPGWFSDSSITAGSTHRYLLTSSAAVILLITLLLQKLQTKTLIVVTALICTFNLNHANKIIKQDALIRGIDITQPLYDKQNSEVPEGEKYSIFIVQGNTELRGSAFDFSAAGTLPFALKRKISNEEDIPAIGVSTELVAKLVCYENISRPYLEGWREQKHKNDISHVHSWFLTNDGVLQNTSDIKRVEIAHSSDCLSKKVNQEVDKNIKLLSTLQLDKLNSPNKRAISLAWQLNDHVERMELTMKLIDHNKQTNSQSFVFDSQNKIEPVYITTIYQDANLPIPTSINISIVSKEKNTPSLNKLYDINTTL